MLTSQTIETISTEQEICERIIPTCISLLLLLRFVMQSWLDLTAWYCISERRLAQCAWLSEDAGMKNWLF